MGDPDQSIYSWRNADIRNILSFQADFTEAKVIALEENYRSTQTILDAAHGLISANTQRVEKELFTQKGRGVPIVVAEQHNEEEEAQFVIQEIQSLAESGHALGDIAVMYRVNAQSRALEESCLRHGVRYQVVGGQKFYQRQEVKDLAAYLRLVANPNDDVSLARVVNVPARGIGRRTMDELVRIARDEGIPMSSVIERIANSPQDAGEPSEEFPTVEHSLATRSARALTGFMALIKGLAVEARSTGLLELIDLVLERSGYKRYLLEEADRGEERWENIQEFRASARDFLHLGIEDALTAFLESVSLVSDVDSFEERSELVTLITLHQAKGLEFPVVFIVGMEEGLLPHIRSMDNPAEMEEERRLCYVGITRAQERLYLLRAFRRGFQGGYEPRDPSRFLADIPRDMIVSPRRGSGRVSRNAGWSPQPAVKAAKETDGTRPPKVGEKVRHAIFGDGIVISTKPSGEDFEVTVAFKDGRGVKRLLLSFAPLETVS